MDASRCMCTTSHVVPTSSFWWDPSPSPFSGASHAHPNGGTYLLLLPPSKSNIFCLGFTPISRNIMTHRGIDSSRPLTVWSCVYLDVSRRSFKFYFKLRGGGRCVSDSRMSHRWWIGWRSWEFGGNPLTSLSSNLNQGALFCWKRPSGKRCLQQCWGSFLTSIMFWLLLMAAVYHFTRWQ